MKQKNEKSGKSTRKCECVNLIVIGILENMAKISKRKSWL